MCHVFDTQTNYLCRDIAITDTKVSTPSNSYRSSNEDEKPLIDGKTNKDCNHKMENHVKNKHQLSGISSSTSSAAIAKTQPIEIKAGLHKRQLSHYLTEITFSTAL